MTPDRSTVAALLLESLGLASNDSSDVDSLFSGMVYVASMIVDVTIDGYDGKS